MDRKRYYYICDSMRYHVLTDNYNMFEQYIDSYKDIMAKTFYNGKAQTFSIGTVDLYDSEYNRYVMETQHSKPVFEEKKVPYLRLVD